MKKEYNLPIGTRIELIRVRKSKYKNPYKLNGLKHGSQGTIIGFYNKEIVTKWDNGIYLPISKKDYFKIITERGICKCMD